MALKDNTKKSIDSLLQKKPCTISAFCASHSLIDICKEEHAIMICLMLDTKGLHLAHTYSGVSGVSHLPNRNTIGKSPNFLFIFAIFSKFCALGTS